MTISRLSALMVAVSVLDCAPQRSDLATEAAPKSRNQERDTIGTRSGRPILHWTPEAIPLDFAFVNGIWGSGPSDVYALVTHDDSSDIYHLTDSGRWDRSIATTDVLTSTWGSGPDDVYCVGFNIDPFNHFPNPIYHSIDGGKSWHAWRTLQYVQGVWGTSRADVYVGGEILLHSVDAGITWQWIPMPGIFVATGWATDWHDILAIGIERPQPYYYEYATFHSMDEGASWRRTPLLGTNTQDRQIRAVWGSSRNDIFAVGHPGLILHSVDVGKTWTMQDSGFSRTFWSIWGSGPDDVYVVGEQASVFHSTDGGTNWTKIEVPLPISANIYAIWGSSANDIYLGANQALLHGQP